MARGKSSGKSKNVAFLLVQVGALAGLIGGVFYYHNSTIEPTTVYQMNKDLDSNTQITENDIVEVNIPKSAVTAGMNLSEDEIVGKYTDTKVSAGQYIDDSMVVEKDEVDPFESMDLTTLRKVTLPVSLEEGLGGNLARGSKVDLVYVGSGEKSGSTGSNEFTYSKAFMSDVYVYAVGTDDGYKYEDTSGHVKGSTEEGEDLSTTGENGKLATVTLALTLSQAEEVMARLETGGIKIVGQFGEAKTYDTSGYIIGDFEKQFAGEGKAETNSK